MGINLGFLPNMSLEDAINREIEAGQVKEIAAVLQTTIGKINLVGFQVATAKAMLMLELKEKKTKN